MFGIGMTEMLVIAVIALIFIGPDQIPEVARNVGKFLNELRRSTDDLKKDFQQQTGLPRNFDEWLETRREETPARIAAPVAAAAAHDPPSTDEDGQMSMNLEADDAKEPKKS